MVQNWHDGVVDAMEGTGSLEKFEGAPDHSTFVATQGPVELGRCFFEPHSESLILINHRVGIERKALLMGFSKKARHCDVIGAFGEGMKVGALALLRRGLGVQIETRDEKWVFGLDLDPTFKEKVLSVRIGARNAKPSGDVQQGTEALSADDTLTRISGVCFQEWVSMAPRFLFLCPPRESVRTEQGRLLLDEELRGQLYVKGIWINDLSDDRLSTGVDFFEMRLDRDRAAVLRRSDIDHQVSSMWARAVIKNPDLVPRYFELLSAENAHSDVSFADTYCDEDAVALIAQEYVRLHGTAVPVSSREANLHASKLRHLSESLDRAAVVCSHALLNILRKSDAVCTDLHALLENNAISKRRLVPEASWSLEERSRLAHACRLATAAIPASPVDLAHIDMFEFPGSLGEEQLCRCSMCGSRVEISRELLCEERVHEQLGGCLTPDQGSCWCCEAQLVNLLLQSRGGNLSRLRLRLLSVVMREVCGQQPRSCEPAHHAAGSLAMAEEREVSLQHEASAIATLLATEREDHASEVGRMQQDLRDLKREVTAAEFRLMDLREEAKADALEEVRRCQREAESAKKQLEELRCQSSRTAAFLSEQLDQASERLVLQEEANERRTISIAKQIQSFKATLTRRREVMELLEKVVVHYTTANQASLEQESLPDLSSSLREIQQQLGEDDGQFLCCVCAAAQSNVVLLPCRHKQLCGVCASSLRRCPLCRSTIQNRIEVFE